MARRDRSSEAKLGKGGAPRARAAHGRGFIEKFYRAELAKKCPKGGSFDNALQRRRPRVLGLNERALRKITAVEERGGIPGVNPGGTPGSPKTLSLGTRGFLYHCNPRVREFFSANTPNFERNFPGGRFCMAVVSQKTLYRYMDADRRQPTNADVSA